MRTWTVFFVTVAVILTLLVYTLSKELFFHDHNNVGYDDDDDDDDDNNVTDGEITREEGLVLLEALVCEKPYPDDCGDIVRFLKTFKANKNKWKVTSADLRRIFRSVVRNPFSQVKQFAMSKRCMGNKLGFYLDD
jgi:hypothetical protein